MVFRHTVLFVGLFLAAETIVFGFLYRATVAVYERRTDDAILVQADDLKVRFEGLQATYADLSHTSVKQAWHNQTICE